MRGRVNVKMFITFGLVIIIVYCGIRTLMTMTAGKRHIAQINSSVSGLNLEPVLRDLEQGFFSEADAVNLYDVTRNPLVIGKPASQESSAKKSLSYTPVKSKARELPRLTGLVLDENPVAIMEIRGVSVEVKIGDFLDGKKVVHIDELGVHLFADGKLEIIR